MMGALRGARNKIRVSYPLAYSRILNKRQRITSSVEMYTDFVRKDLIMHDVEIYTDFVSEYFMLCTCACVV